MNDDLKAQSVEGKFVDMDGDRFYAIYQADKLAPFFVSLISDSDHWMFVSSTGGLTAGRVSPETALFPYITVDRTHESTSHTGPKTIVKGKIGEANFLWEPFNQEHDGRFNVSRNIYKNTLGNKLCLEEYNQDLELVFRYFWESSEEFGFRRTSRVVNTGTKTAELEFVDGLLNLLPAGTPRFTQTNSSNLVDAYKWTEFDKQSGLAMFTLYSGITDRAEPCESLKANTVFALGVDDAKVMLSDEQLNGFKQGLPITEKPFNRGTRGAYLLYFEMELAPGQERNWSIVADLEKSQSEVVGLLKQLGDAKQLAQAIEKDVLRGSDALARIMASSDGFQSTNEENVSVHHYANVLFNVLRGGIFDDQYQVSSKDFCHTIKTFNQDVYQSQQGFLSLLPEKITIQDLLAQVAQQQDPQLSRLTLEYLPITFGRRHGDPSRPWNQFEIKLKDDQGQPLLSYQGNWRDIFQNWEALTFSYPEFVESVIAKFVNASTIDGYNPYRVTKEGIDWEVEEPDDPWSYIGYWGDHQIIYLQKMLELSKAFHPGRLNKWLREDLFCYANVPYRITSYEGMLENAKSTVSFDEEVAAQIDELVASLGSDGKMLLDGQNKVYQVNLLEKLLVPLLCKLGNLVVDGGIWLNAQRPEWNDANNALVGQGLSMVTLYYMRRYLKFMQDLLAQESGSAQVSSEVVQWFAKTAEALSELASTLGEAEVSDAARRAFLDKVGKASSDYRLTVYQQKGFSGKSELSIAEVSQLLSDALVAIDHSIAHNLDKDGLYHAYNLLDLESDEAGVNHLYAMLEGQVAALSSGALDVDSTVKVLDALFASDVYRPDQKTFMLYPDRSQVSFLNKNCVPSEKANAIPLIKAMLSGGDNRVVEQDADHTIRFNAAITNAQALADVLDGLHGIDSQLITSSKDALLALYEEVFNHQAFTGRSGGMFGFEGLGCVYWHMVSKLLLAVAEVYVNHSSTETNAVSMQKLGALYYRVREGIGFNKTPEEYGAFPTDPYSHTPKHAGAQQPGMTGQVKEEVLSRFIELGVEVSEGTVNFAPKLLRQCEFTQGEQQFRYLDVNDNWQGIALATNQLAFTWCQVPVVYHLSSDKSAGMRVVLADGTEQIMEKNHLDAQLSETVFKRTGHIKEIYVAIDPQSLFA